MLVTKESLRESVYQYYPKGVSVYSEAYDNSPEYAKMKKVLEQAMADERWQAFKSALNEVNELYAIIDMSFYAPVKPCFHLTLKVKGWMIQVHNGILVPAFGIVLDTANYNRQLNEDFSNAPPAIKTELQAIVLLLEKYFNYSFFPAIYANDIVADVSTNRKDIGHATLYGCLLTDVPF